MNQLLLPIFPNDTKMITTVLGVGRWKKKLSEEGESAFFIPENRLGHSHKLLPDVLARIQGQLDKGKGANGIAKEEGISEGSIRCTVSQSRLKNR